MYGTRGTCETRTRCVRKMVSCTSCCSFVVSPKTSIHLVYVQPHSFMLFRRRMGERGWCRLCVSSMSFRAICVWEFPFRGNLKNLFKKKTAQVSYSCAKVVRTKHCEFFWVADLTTADYVPGDVKWKTLLWQQQQQKTFFSSHPVDALKSFSAAITFILPVVCHLHPP